MIRDLILQNRSCRRFYQEVPIELESLREFVDLARLSASAANRQPLKYFLAGDPHNNAVIFSCLGWAAYLEDWPGPPEGERPAAYIIILGDSTISKSFFCDHGIAAQSILLGAREQGLGGCIHATIEREKLRSLPGIPEQYEILLAISLGKPKETIVLETVKPEGDIKYWRDACGVHHVPKRKLDDIIIN
jgi:nitroreductase